MKDCMLVENVHNLQAIISRHGLKLKVHNDPPHSSNFYNNIISDQGKVFVWNV